MENTPRPSTRPAPWLLDILRAPDTGDALRPGADGESLVGPDRSFPMPDGIPSFISTDAAAGAFDYTSHYATDAEVFDYFDDEPDPITALHLRLLRLTVTGQVPAGAASLLDVGCGCAYVARRFCHEGRRVVSLDIARANVVKALEACPSPDHAGVVADAFHLPFADGSLDCIIASEIIEHTVDPAGFLAALVAKLKPGGTLVVSTPYKERIAYSLCIHCNCKTPHNAHLHSFDMDKMHRMVAPLPADITGMRLVGNKLLLRSHAVVPLSHLGPTLWGGLDRCLNSLLPKAEHFVITIRKRG